MKKITNSFPAIIRRFNVPRRLRSMLFLAMVLSLNTLSAFAQSTTFSSTTLQTGISNSLAVIMMFGFVLGIFSVIYGGFAIRRGDVDQGKMSILGGAIIAAAPAVVYAFYKIFGLDTSSAVGVGSFTGHLKTAEAIYDGPSNNLVGIETFSGSADNKSPQHAVLLGMSGAGKSVSVCDLLSQTEGYFAYTVIIEEGLSYGIYTQTVEPEARPIIIHPDGDLTINYLDTKGLPLTPDHLSAATALVARMIGTSSQEDKQMLRQAQIAKYLNLLFEDSFQDWQKKRHDQLLDIARHAMALQKFRTERMPPGATTLETFADFRDQAQPGPTRAKLGLNGEKSGQTSSHTATAFNEWGQNYLAQFDEATVLKFLKDPKTSKEVRNLAFAYFTSEEFPTHRMLQELMMLESTGH